MSSLKSTTILLYNCCIIQNQKEPTPEELDKYLKPTFTIESNNKAIQEKARELTEGLEDTAGKAKSLFYFIRDKIKYTFFVDVSREENYKASTTLQKAVLMIALVRAIGMPARLEFADIIT